MTDAEKFREFDRLQSVASRFGLNLKMADHRPSAGSPKFSLWVRLLPKGKTSAQTPRKDNEDEVIIRTFDYLNDIDIYFEALEDLRRRSDIDFVDCLQPHKLFR